MNNIEDYVAILVSYRDKLPDLNNKYNAGFPYEEMIDVQYSWTTDSTKESIVYLKESITWSQSAPYNNMFEFAPGTNVILLDVVTLPPSILWHIIIILKTTIGKT